MSENEERFQWIDPDTNQLHWLTAEELSAKEANSEPKGD